MTIGAQPLVDFHHHLMPEAILERLRRLAGGAPRLVDDSISITLSPTLADVGAHLEAMDLAGVATAVLSYSGIAVLGPEVCKQLNDSLAALATEHPGRLVAAAHVDLRDPDAPAELERCASVHGSTVAALPCSAPGRTLDSPELDPLWKAVRKIGMTVVLHPALLPAGASTDYALERSCARPFDTTTAAVRLLCGVLPRHGAIRTVLPHCGGTAAFLRGRLAMFFDPPGPGAPRHLPRTVREQEADGTAAAFSALWSNFYFDTAGTGGWEPGVVFTARVAGANRVVFGSDFPLESHSPETLAELAEMVRGLPLADEERSAICQGTAASLLELQPS